MSSVDHLFRQLVAVLRAEDPERLEGPIQISELYQRIIPYRAFKRVLQFETNQDYEMAMLQLLAGEGGFASVEPMEVREALTREANAINPNPGTFRDYAAARVLLNREAVDAAIEGSAAYAPPAAAPASAGATRDPYAPPAEIPPTAGRPFFRPQESVPYEPPGIAEAPDSGASDEEAGPSPDVPAAPTFVAADAPAARSTPAPDEEDTGVCPFCEQALPSGRTVIFCPFCGGRVVPVKCEQCGDELEPDWRYCPACGAAAEA